MSLKSRKIKLKESGVLKSRVRVKTWQLSIELGPNTYLGDVVWFS